MKKLRVRNLPSHLRVLINQQRTAEIKTLLEGMHASEAAEALLELPRFQLMSALTLTNIRQQAAIFAFFPIEIQVEIISELTQRDVVRLVTNLAHDERADLVAELPDALKNAIMQKLDLRDQEDIRKLESYEDHEIGSIMTSDFAALEAGMTVQQAIDALRRRAADYETIYYAYVIDPNRHLQGIVTLKRLITSSPNESIAAIMTEDPITLKTRDHVEAAVKALQKTDLIALPVIDREDRMVGIVTYDDMQDVAEEENTEDFHRIGGSGPIGTLNLSSATPLQLIQKRLPWLMVLIFVNLFSGAGIAYYEETIQAVVTLVVFLPLLIASGGNAGSQSATLMVRAIATGDVQPRDWFRLLRREFVTALIMGGLMGLLIAAIGLFRADKDVALVVALSMIALVMVGSLIGMLLPFILNRFKLDPASASAPLVTSLCDISGVIIYFAIATWYLSDRIGTDLTVVSRVLGG